MIKLRIVEDIEHDVPVGLSYPEFPEVVTLRRLGRDYMSKDSVRKIRDIVSDFIKNARYGQIWKCGGGFGGDSVTIRIGRHGLNDLTINGKKLTRSNVERYIFNGVELIGYEDEPKLVNNDFSDVFNELGYTADTDNTEESQKYSIQITDSNDSSITYDIKVGVYSFGLFIDISAYQDGEFIGKYSIPYKGRSPVKSFTTNGNVEDVYALDDVLRNLSLDSLEKKWRKVE